MVNKTMMQIPDVSATSPVKIHRAAFWNLFGFTMRFSKAATASFGRENDRSQREVDIVDQRDLYETLGG